MPLKRPFVHAAPEPVTAEPAPPGGIIIIHPGSYNLRIGKASDGSPITIPHCIARLKKNPNRPSIPDTGLIRPECNHTESGRLLKQGLKLAEDALLSRATQTGEYHQLIPAKQLASFNSQVRSERTDVTDPRKYTVPDNKPFLFGDEALNLHQSHSSLYTMSWPIRHGRLNLHDRAGGSMAAVLSDLEDIWGTAIATRLAIPVKDLKMYRAILLVPDVYTHKHVKELMNLLLDTLGFSAAIIHQESVMATYGSGLSSACVVDVGDQKTSVCCVEDGLSVKATRMTMEYGGCDVGRCLHWLLSRSGVQLRELSFTSNLDARSLQEIKESVCHMDQSRLGLLECCLEVRRPGEGVLQYRVKLGDSIVLAPLSLLYPDLFGLQGAHLVRTQNRSESDPSDPLDQDYLRQTQRQHQVVVRMGKKDTGDQSRDNEAMLAQMEDGSTLGPTPMDEDSNDGGEGLGSLGALEPMKGGRRAEMEEEDEVVTEPVLQLMGIDDAILYSIEKCDSEDMKRKMYSCILLVGGGMKFEGAQDWLQYRILTQMPPHQRLLLESADIIIRPRMTEMEPELASWKGAAVLACLDTTQEFWIYQKEWQRFSVRLLRERAPFIW